MANNRSFIIKSFIISSMLLLASILYAQTPTNFSGNWELDKTKSKLSEAEAAYPGTKVLHIFQTSSMLIMNSTYSQPGNNDFNTSNDTLNIEGKVKIEKVSDQTRTIKVSWSSDKKILTYKNMSTSNSSDTALMSQSYKLSDDKLTLTVETYGKNKVREIKSTEVYIKK